MEVLNVKYEVPAETLRKLTTGELSRKGSNLRDTVSGRYFGQLTEVGDKKISLENVFPYLITAGVAALATTGLFVGAHFWKQGKEKKLNTALDNYISALREGSLTLDHITELKKRLRPFAGKEVKVSFDQLSALVQLTYDIATQMAAASEYPEEIPAPTDEGKIVDIIDYLEAQEKIYRFAK